MIFTNWNFIIQFRTNITEKIIEWLAYYFWISNHMTIDFQHRYATRTFAFSIETWVIWMYRYLLKLWLSSSINMDVVSYDIASKPGIYTCG